MSKVTKEDIISYIRNFYKENNRPPKIEECHPFSYYAIKQLFKTWNNALRLSNIPVNRHETILTQCKNCEKEFNKQYKEMRKSYNDFCSHSCSAKYNNRGRKMSAETKEKIRQKLIIIRFTKCVMCSKKFSYQKRKRQTCGSKCLSDLKKRNNDIKKGLIIPEY